MNIEPFHFHLRKTTQKDERILDALFSFFPHAGGGPRHGEAGRESIHDAAAEVLSSHLNTQVSLNFEAIAQNDFTSFCDRLPDPAVLVVLGVAPYEDKVVIDIDANLAAFFVERLLGGSGESFPVPKQLSDIEQGVLQYLVLQVLAHIYRFSGEDQRVHYRFEKFAFNSKGVKEIVSPGSSIFSLIIKLTIGKNDGFIRVSFPSPLIEQLYLNAQPRNDVLKLARGRQFERLSALGHLKTPLWVSAGSTTISVQDLKGLEEGDVIMLENSGLEFDEKIISGKATIHTGDGKHGGLIGEVTADSKKIHFRIIDVCKGETI